MLEDKTLKELRELYPDIKATSKSVFIEKINSDDSFDSYDITMPLNSDEAVAYIKDEAESGKKILITLPSRADAENLFQVFVYELFGSLNKRGLTVVGHDKNLTIHIGGKTFVRLSCEKMSLHYQTVTKFTDLINAE